MDEDEKARMLEAFKIWYGPRKAQFKSFNDAFVEFQFLVELGDIDYNSGPIVTVEQENQPSSSHLSSQGNVRSRRSNFAMPDSSRQTRRSSREHLRSRHRSTSRTRSPSYHGESRSQQQSQQSSRCMTPQIPVKISKHERKIAKIKTVTASGNNIFIEYSDTT